MYVYIHIYTHISFLRACGLAPASLIASATDPVSLLCLPFVFFFDGVRLLAKVIRLRLRSAGIFLLYCSTVVLNENEVQSCSMFQKTRFGLAHVFQILYARSIPRIIDLVLRVPSVKCVPSIYLHFLL